jgi:hypothetical protein
MTSPRRLRANRANARRSTGPKTATGRAKVAQNARRHGLRIPVLSDPNLSAEVAAIAQKIAGDAAPDMLEPARWIAEAQVDVMRVRRARTNLVSQLLGSTLPVVGPDLAIMDRYERRALSRRKFAIRAFDAARAAAIQSNTNGYDGRFIGKNKPLVETDFWPNEANKPRKINGRVPGKRGPTV